MGIVDGVLNSVASAKDVDPDVSEDEAKKMTPQELARKLPYMSDDELSKIDHATLYLARQYVPSDQQNRISPFEHRAFAREATAENPLLALPIAAGTVLYQPYKAIMGSRSAPALDQVGQGLVGVGEGIVKGVRSALSI